MLDLTFEEWKLTQIIGSSSQPGWHGKYWNKVDNVKRHGVLKVLISFDEYLFKAYEAGISSYQDVSHGYGKYHLSRFNDEGDYTIESCRFVLATENLSEKSREGEQNGKATLTNEQVKSIYLDTDDFDDIAFKYNTSRRNIWDIKNSRRWDSVTKYLLPRYIDIELQKQYNFVVKIWYDDTENYNEIAENYLTTQTSVWNIKHSVTYTDITSNLPETFQEYLVSKSERPLLKGPILIVVAHPDDAEINAGGLIHNLTRNGVAVHVCVCTHNSSPERKSEAIKAINELGLYKSDITLFDYPDTRLYTTLHEIATSIEQLIVQYNINTVITHYPFDTHQDHNITSQASIIAGRNVDNIIYFRPTYPSGRPDIPFNHNLIFKLNQDDIDSKIKALSHHKSQIKKYGELDYLQTIRDIAKSDSWVYGGSHGYAELFQISRMRY